MCSACGDDEGRLYPTIGGCISCILLRKSSARYSGCWNKKSRPLNLKKRSHPFSFSSSFQYLTILVLITLTYFPLVTTATKNASSSIQETSSSPSQQSHHSNNSNTNVASQQKGLSDLFESFDLQHTPMTTLISRNITVGYLNSLMEEFGTNGSMGKKQLSKMMEDITQTHKQRDEKGDGKKPGDHRMKSGVKNGDHLSSVLCTTQSFIYGIDDSARKNYTNLNYSVEEEEENGKSFHLTQLSCQVNKCMNSSSIYKLFNLSDNYQLTRTDLLLLAPLILRQVKTCQENTEEVINFSKSSEAWAYGFLFVTVINICALVGVVVLPIMNTRIYKKVLLFLVALAVGSLAGSGLLVLIPEAFELVGTREEKHAYLWMGSTIMSGIYLFFLIERLLKIIFEWKKLETIWPISHGISRRKKTTFDCGEFTSLNPEDKRGKNASDADYDVIMDKNENQQLECTTDELSDIVCSVKSKTPVDLDTAKMKDPANYHASASQCTSQLSRTDSAESIEVKLQKKSSNDDNILNAEVSNGCLRSRMDGGKKKKKTIRTVAWMIIFGDGLHNFIDGLSIGAAFTANIMTGVSVSVAVICEELPHELGDFAILLNAGMSMKQALCFNFLSACMCYIGLIFGILLAEATAAHTWIFGVAGGMFLYISLVDMMPEMNQVVEAKENRELGLAQLFILQNVGMIMGFSIILVISLYAENIKFIS